MSIKDRVSHILIFTGAEKMQRTAVILLQLTSVSAVVALRTQANVIKLFSPLNVIGTNKLECLFPEGLSSLV
jgi:hypothetical protein